MDEHHKYPRTWAHEVDLNVLELLFITHPRQFGLIAHADTPHLDRLAPPGHRGRVRHSFADGREQSGVAAWGESRFPFFSDGLGEKRRLAAVLARAVYL